MKEKVFLLIILLGLVINSGYAIANKEPIKTIEIEIPEYKTYKIGDFDYVDIPGGKVLLEEGKPRVPYYSISINYPIGYRVQEVIMRERSELMTAMGLNLSVVTLVPEFSSSNESPPTTQGGWYPEEDYTWETWVNSNGSSTLLISIFPFYYNPNTTEVRFYRYYKFEIFYVSSAVSIIDLTMNKEVYDPGEKVTVDVFLNNSGKAQDIVVSALVKQYVSGIVIDGLPLRVLRNVMGQASFSMTWDSKGFPVGDYFMEITLNDTLGNWLDRGICLFKLGKPLLNITGFDVEPKHFKIGDKVEMSLEALNTGSTTLDGKCIFMIQNENGTIWNSYQNFSSFSPKSSLKFTSTWDTSSAKKGALYYVIGYVSYESRTTPLMVIMISTNYLPIAKFSYTPIKVGMGEEVTFDASASSDSDGTISSYKWEFGDGGEGSGVKVKHSYHGLGDYKVTLTVIDNERGSNSTSQLIKVVLMYTLNVSSNIAIEIPGSGKYKEGEEVTLSAPSSVSMSGIFGILGGKYNFKQWSGALNSTENTVKLAFTGYDTKLEMKAIYVEDYFNAIIILLVIILAIVAIVAIYLRSRKKKKPS